MYMDKLKSIQYGSKHTVIRLNDRELYFEKLVLILIIDPFAGSETLEKNQIHTGYPDH